MGSNKHTAGEFGRGMSVEVRNNDVNRAMRKLKKLVNQEGIIKELRDRQHFVKPSALKRKAKAQGKKRWQKKLAKIQANW